MGVYILRRLLLIPLTLLGILTANFFIAQVAPGGPVERTIAALRGVGTDALGRVSGAASAADGAPSSSARGSGETYRGAQGLDPDFIKRIEAQYGFDKPIYERYWKMLADYAVLDLGESFYRSQGVLTLVLEKLPVSASLGIWSTVVIYLVSIPLGVAKAMRDGSRFDVATSWAIVIGYATPAFLFAIVLIVVFAGGRYLDWFPLRGLTSENWGDLSALGKIGDYLWHLALPVTAMAIGGFATLTMLTKNAFLEEINKHYVVTARAKGLSERQTLYGHVFRNAMLLIVAGFPATLVSTLFAGSVLIEVIFSLDGLGLLGFEAVINRDYPVMFGALYIFGLLGLILNLISDLAYHAVDPRIDFEARS